MAELPKDMIFHYHSDDGITIKVDAIQLVRCKDCKHWVPGYITDNDDFIPPKCGRYQQMVGHSASDYCSFGEREVQDGANREI